MKRTISTFLLATTTVYISPAFSQYSFYPFPHYAPESAVYITVGGGVSWVEHDDFYRHPITPTAFLEVRQPSSSDNVVASINAALGYQFHVVPLRAEVAYRWIDDAHYEWDPIFVVYEGHFGPGKIGSEAVLFNVYFDYYNTTRFIPFIGAGIGYAQNRSTFTIKGDGVPEVAQHNTDDNFAWGASAGVKYEISSSLFVDVRAEYLSLGEVQLNELFQGNSVGLMKTDELYTISALANITYAYNFLSKK